MPGGGSRTTRLAAGHLRARSLPITPFWVGPVGPVGPGPFVRSFLNSKSAVLHVWAWSHTAFRLWDHGTSEVGPGRLWRPSCMRRPATCTAPSLRPATRLRRPPFPNASDAVARHEDVVGRVGAGRGRQSPRSRPIGGSRTRYCESTSALNSRPARSRAAHRSFSRPITSRRWRSIPE